MRRTPDPISLRAHVLHDIGTIAILALVLVPFYLLLNHYWRSLTLLVAIYGVLGLAFFRLGRYIRRVMRRLPAEIPPWHVTPTRGWSRPQPEWQFAAADAIRSAHQDPYYLEEVLKPRLRRLLAYRMSGIPHMPLETLDDLQRAQIEPAVLAFLQRRDAIGLWAKYRYRRQRGRDVLETLRQLQGL